MFNIDSNTAVLVAVLAGIVTIATGLFKGWGWLGKQAKKIKHLFTRYKPKIPNETLRIYPDLKGLSWHVGSSNGKPAMQIVGRFSITNITGKEVSVVGVKIVKPKKARVEGMILVRHPQQDVYGRYPILAHSKTKASADFWVQPVMRDYGEDLKASLVFIDQYTNEHIIKVVFKGVKPREPKKSDTQKESVSSLTDPIEKQVVSVLKAEVDRYKNCGRRVGGLGSIQAADRGRVFKGVGTRWKTADSPENQALVKNPENSEITSDNADVLFNLYQGLEDDKQRERLVSTLLKRLDRNTEYAPVGYLILFVLFRVGKLSEALKTAKDNLQGDSEYGFSDLIRLLEGLLFYKYQSFALDDLDNIEVFLSGIDENETFSIPERIAAIRTLLVN